MEREKREMVYDQIILLCLWIYCFRNETLSIAFFNFDIFYNWLFIPDHAHDFNSEFEYILEENYI